MSVNEFEIGKFRVLDYLYRSIVDGEEPNEAKGQRVTGLNPVFWRAVVADLRDSGMIAATELRASGEVAYGGLRITSAGAEFLIDSPPSSALRAASIGEAAQRLQRALDLDGFHSQFVQKNCA